MDVESVESIGPGQWRVTTTPVEPRRGGAWWVGCGPTVELGVSGGRKAGQAAADEYLTSTQG